MPADIFVQRRNNSLFFFAALGALTVGSIVITKYDVAAGFTSVGKALVWGVSNFYPDAHSLTKLPDIAQKLWETVLMSVAATTVAAVFAVVLAMIGSRTTRINTFFSVIARGLASVFRNIPLVAWAMILMLAFSQSLLTGYLALFFGSLGFLTRAFIETVDEASIHAVEALQGDGRQLFLDHPPGGPAVEPAADDQLAAVHDRHQHPRCHPGRPADRNGHRVLLRPVLQELPISRRQPGGDRDRDHHHGHRDDLELHPKDHPVMRLPDTSSMPGRLTDSAVAQALRLPVKPLTKQTVVIRLLLLVLAVTTVYAFSTIDYDSIDLAKAVADTLANLKIIFLHPGGARLSFSKALYEVVITLGLAFLSTLFGGTIALFLGLLGAQNLAPKPVTNIVKVFVALIRAVPTILWVLIFAVTAGLGATAAVIGMTFHTISYLTKAYAEAFEDLDRSVIEALKASGANWWQIVFQAVIPSSFTYLLSWTFLRLRNQFCHRRRHGCRSRGIRSRFRSLHGQRLLFRPAGGGADHLHHLGLFHGP